MTMTMNTTTSQTKTIYPADAAVLLAAGWRYQRKLRPNLVRHYASRIRDVQFHQASTIILGYWPGREVAAIIDGQHRLAAIVEADLAVVTTVLMCEFANEEEARLAYVETDRGGKRTVADIVRATPHEGITDALYGVLRSAVRELIGPSRITDQVLTDACREWIGDIVALQAALPVSLNSHHGNNGSTQVMIAAALSSRIPLSFALATMRDDRGAAIEFWRAVVAFDGSNVTAATAAGVLMTTLGAGTKERKMAQRRLARCWVAAKAGVDLRLAKAVKTTIAGFEF